MWYTRRTRSLFPVLALVVIASLMLGACVAPVTQAPTTGTTGTGPTTYRGYTFDGDKFPDGTTITYMGGMNPEQRRTLREDANWFKEATNIDMQIELGDDAKFNALLAAGTPPDLYYCSYPGIQAADGTFMPIDDYVDADFIARFPPEFKEGFTGLDGKLYGVQMGGWFPVFMINTQLLADAGEDVPTNDWTWDDVVRIGQKVTKDVNGNTPLDADFDPANVDVWGVHMGWFADDILPLSNGGRRVDPSGTKLLMDDPAFQDAWRWWSDLVNTYQIQAPRSWYGAVGQSASELFFTGKLAMFAEGLNYDLYTRANEVFGENWKMVAYPHPAGKELVMSRYQGGACVSSKTENPEAAVEALEFLATAGFIWYPNLWLTDIAYADYWIAEYPFLADTGYADTIAYTLERVGPDPWHEQSSPFDADRYIQGWDFGDKWNQVMDNKLTFDEIDFAAYTQQGNEMIIEGMTRDLEQTVLTDTAREALEGFLAERQAEMGQ